MVRRKLQALPTIGVIATLWSFQTLLTQAHATVFSDTEFSDSDWSHVLILDTGGGTTATVAQVLSGGNPDAYQEGTLSFATTKLYHAHLLHEAIHDPTMHGAIASITYSLDFAVLSGSGICGPNPSDPQVGIVGILLKQGDDYFAPLAEVLAPSRSEGWITVGQSSLGQNDFALVTPEWLDETINPDFSGAGSPIQLGYLTKNSTGSSHCSRTWGGDNYFVAIAVQVVQVGESTWGRVKRLYR